MQLVTNAVNGAASYRSRHGGCSSTAFEARHFCCHLAHIYSRPAEQAAEKALVLSASSHWTVSLDPADAWAAVDPVGGEATGKVRPRPTILISRVGLLPSSPCHRARPHTVPGSSAASADLRWIQIPSFGFPTLVFCSSSEVLIATCWRWLFCASAGGVQHPPGGLHPPVRLGLPPTLLNPALPPEK